MINNSIKNNISLMKKSQREYTRNETARYGSVDQRSTTYRRNGMLNFGARQMVSFDGDSGVFIIGVGGPPKAG